MSEHGTERKSRVVALRDRAQRAAEFSEQVLALLELKVNILAGSMPLQEPLVRVKDITPAEGVLGEISHNIGQIEENLDKMNFAIKRF